MAALSPMALLQQSFNFLHQPELVEPQRRVRSFGSRTSSRSSPTGRSRTPDRESELFDLTPIQQEILLSLGPQTAWTSFSFEVPDQMAFSIDRLRMTWQATAAHHPILRTVIVASDDGAGSPRQRVVRQILPMGFGAWEPVTKTVPYLVYEEGSQTGPSLTLHYHRALIDNKSLTLIRDDFELFFQGYAFPTRVPFSSYAKSITDSRQSDARAFWNSYLEGYQAKIFSTSSVSPVETVQPGDVGLLGQVEDFAQDYQVSMDTVLMAAWIVTTSRHLESHDVAFYTRLRDTGLDSTEYIVGPMEVTAPLRVKTVAKEPVLQFLHRLEDEEEKGSGHTFIGSQGIADSIQAKEAIQFAFSVLESDVAVPAASPSNNFAIQVNFMAASGLLVLKHDQSIPAARANIFLQHFWEALRQLTLDPYAPLQSIGVVSEAETAALSGFHATHSNISPRLVHDLIQEQALQNGAATALQFEMTESLSFSQLNRAANRVARQLVAQMPSKSAFIPVHMDVSVNMVIALLAILKAGGAYVILDPAQPTSRKEYILHDTNAPFYITANDGVEVIPGTKALLIEDLAQSPLGKDGEADLNLALDTESPAYIIYTSGSTGNPKGVVLSHRAASTGILCAPTIPNYRNLLFYNPVFSAAQRTILSTLSKGGCLCLASRSKLQLSLSSLVKDMQVNTLGITSSTIALLDPDNTPTLQRITLTGEAPDPSIVARWTANVELRNNYGLSECTQLNWGRALSTSSELSARNVGFPADTTSAFVLDADSHQLTPFLIPGELCLQGPQLASGYLNQPELTAKAFIDSPFAPGQKLYRTGDMAVRLEDGSIEIIGRLDFQTKINGQRVEPAEISALLQKDNDVVAAAVVAATVEGDKALVACIVHRHDDEVSWPQRVKHLRKVTQDNLPAYMTPAYWLSHDALPLNQNGKADILSLRRHIESMTRSELIAASSIAEEDTGRALSYQEAVLQSVWASVLQLPIEVVTPSRSFLSLGGDSLKALQVISELLSQNFVAELGDLLRSDSLVTAASLLKVQDGENFQPPAPYSLVPAGTIVDQETYEDLYPITPLQEGIISAHRTAGGYVYHRVYRIDDVDKQQLQNAFQSVIDANPMYRTAFIENGTTLLQAVHKSFQLPWQTLDNLSVAQYLEQDSQCLQDIDITKPPVYAAVVNRNALVITMHHALFDYWSSRFLFDDVASTYLQHSVAPRSSFNVFVRHLQQNLDEKIAAQFWSEYLKDAAPTRLATGGEFNAVQRTVNQDLRAFTTSTGLSLGALMYAAWSVILWKHTGNADITFAITLSGRDAPIQGVQDLNGPTLTTVPIRVKLQPSMTLVEVVRSVQDELWNVAPHSQFGLRRVLQASSKTANFFDSMVNFLIKPEASPAAEVFKPYADRPIWQTGYTSLELEESGEGDFDLRLSGFLETVRTGFIADQVVKLLDTVISSSGSMSLRDLDIVTDAEALYLHSLSKPVTPTAQFLHHGFEEIAAAAGDRTAIEFFGDSEPVSYAELNRRANQLARYLIDNGVGPDTLVPLCLPKSVEMISTILAILKAGGGFVPLDSDNPPERNNFIVKDVAATMVLTDENLRGIFDEAGAEVRVVDVYNVDLSGYSDANVALDHLDPGHLAYAIYTSGSTGLPKGVLIPHGSIAAGIESIIEAEQWQREWRVLQFSNYVFDVSVGDIFCTLTTGATLCMAPMESLLSDLAQVINEMQIDRLFITPTVAKLIQPVDVPGVQGLYLAGEPVTPDLVEIWTPHCLVMNCYGPTEASILAAAGAIEQGGNNRVIGHPLKNCVSLIVEPDSLRLAPYGAIGELCLAGPQLARGYLNRPEATAKAFVTRGDERIYRTGDLARWLENHRIECFGRKDSQVKINGHRIELGEIESAVLKTNKVHHAIVTVVEIQKKAQLVAFCVVDPANPQAILPAQEYLETLTTVSISLTSLPPYMVPTIWIPMGTLPLLPSGKTNRKKLVEWVQTMDAEDLQQYSQADAPAEFVDAVTVEEKLLQSLWANLFNKEAGEISATSPFFAHGGDSISAINLVSHCKRQGYTLAVSDVLAFPLLQDMASRMRPVKTKSKTAVEETIAVDVPASVWDALDGAGLQKADVEKIYPAVAGVEDFLVRGAKKEQFWQCQTVRPLPDVLDFERWIEVTTELTARNEILRSMWIEASNQWLQIVLTKPILDLKTIACASEEDKQAQINLAWDTPFEVSNGTPFIRYRLFTLPDGSRDLYLKIHHAMYDGTLLRIFDDEFKALFKRHTPPPTVSFHDYVQYMQGTDKAKSLVFWTDLLKDSPAPYPAACNPVASTFTLAATDRRVDSFAANCGVTVPIVFQTAFALLLSRLSSNPDVTFDNLITGRNVDMEEAQSIAGTCANFLPFRSTFDTETRIRDLLKSTQSLFWKTTENGNVSLNDVYGALGLEREQSCARALFLFQPFDAPPPTTNVVEKHMRWMVMALSKVRMPIDYALHLEVSKTPTGYNLKWKYDPQVYPVEEFEAVIKNFADILEKMMEHSRSTVVSIL
ncbi:putative nonribosomal peptide synthase [Aspergillus clavatus NRRL 1]|uniref:Nonribosomal peptide synthase, putative n=1 Tax=Aspergillus clavatus (strain ATCC 1007 / CBS 513.65 / DSM 816 / NCTC 3887 / NRRL 1 / QM 1276 / 107) TaxID=344612 RepID=A1C8T2_ASPCL|nr:nonribosomal peptide synthase, putative [Aspergillus clavatus NRRL 1]EAW13719.1 nonribosomal peptide synthase, putative [Aspergillus clavatus NRRL 1]